MVIVYKYLAASLFAIMNPTGIDDPAKLKPVGMLQGHDTLIDYPLVRMIRDAKTWSELWILHKGVPAVSTGAGTIANGDAQPLPKVDFDKNQVLIVFGGQMQSIQAFDYLQTATKDKTAIVQLAPNRFGTSTPSVVMTPYILLVLPKLKVPIEVQLDSLSADGTHFWNPIATFPIIKDK